jgi:undecaprenyl-diphosphatase
MDAVKGEATMDTARALLSIDRNVGRLAALDLAACRAMQQRTGEWVRTLLALVSRGGDGWVWGSCALVLLLVDATGAGFVTVLEMAVAAAIGLPLYRVLKQRMARPRPCAAAGSGLVALVPALDLYSFPSGHTLHAVAFTAVILGHYPTLAWLLIPFSVLVALSRVVLGLHYPSDVLAGAALGSLLGLLPRLVDGALG